MVSWNDGSAAPPLWARIGVAVLAVIAAYLLVPFLLIRVAHRFPPWVDPDQPVLALQALFVVGIALAVRMPLRSVVSFRLPATGLRAVFWLLLGGVVIALLFSMTVISTSLPSNVGFSVSDGLRALSSRFPNTGLFGGVLRLALLAPVFEEFLFRALILGYLLRMTRPWIALAVSTALFAACHDDWWVPAFIGFAMGLLYLRHRNVWLCALGHAGHNALASAAVPLLMAYLYEANMFAPISSNLLVLQMSWLVVALACFSAFFLQVLRGADGEVKLNLLRDTDTKDNTASLARSSRR